MNVTSVAKRFERVHVFHFIRLILLYSIGIVVYSARHILHSVAYTVYLCAYDLYI